MNRTALFLMLAYVVLVFFLSTRPGLRPPGGGMHYTDKVAHFIEYAILGTLIARTFRSSVNTSRLGAFMFLLAIGATIGAIDETIQGHTPDREMSVYDWMADVAGVAAAVWFVMRRRQGPAPAHGGEAK
jgi:VanZ family protein